MDSLALHIRRLVLAQSRRAGVGHIGSSLSIADLMATLYGGVLRVDDPSASDRDRMVLSKGHAALALYAALHATGRLSEQQLDSFCADGSLLGGHPEHALDYIDFSTGSLGQGLSVGAGAALAARLDGSTRRVFVLLSDAECNEGSVWEAIMFAAHHRLSNLTAVVDLNGQQALGYTRDVMDLEPMAARWEAFGWRTYDVDGHDCDAQREVFSSVVDDGGSPHVMLARTTFGKGVNFMENQIAWHYWPMDEEQYATALRGLEGVGS
jgi:transketolase